MDRDTVNAYLYDEEERYTTDGNVATAHLSLYLITS